MESVGARLRKETSTKYFITIWVKRDHVPGTEHFNTQRVVSEVHPDLQDPELGHCDAGLLRDSLPVVLRDEVLGVELGQTEHEVNLTELIIEDPGAVKTSAVSKEVLAEYL